MSQLLFSEFSGPAPVFCHHFKLPPFFRSRYKLIVHFYYCFFFWRFLCVLLAQWPHNAPTNSILLGKHIVHWAMICSIRKRDPQTPEVQVSKQHCTEIAVSNHRNQLYLRSWKWSKNIRHNDHSLCLTWTKRAINGSRQSTVTKIVVNATFSSTLILSMWSFQN